MSAHLKNRIMRNNYVKVQNRNIILFLSFKAVFILLIVLFGSVSSYATVAVTRASASICKNYAATGPAARWTTLGTMTLTEGSASNFGNSTGSWSVTITLAAPAGWQFNASVNPSLTFTSGKDVTSVAQSSLTFAAFTFVVAGTGKIQKDIVKITGLQVQATSTTSVSSTIKPSSIVGYASGISTSSNFSTLTMSAPSTGTASVSVAVSPSATICAGTNVTFTATTANGGTPLYQWTKNGSNISGATTSVFSSSSLVNGDAIACSIVSSSCITNATATSSAVTMTVNPVPNVSNFTGIAASSPCKGSAATLTVVSSTLASGSYTASYDISGANSGSGYTDVLTVSGTNGTLPIQASVIANAGATTITINSLTSAAGCVANLSTGNTANFTVNALPAAVSVAGAGTYCGGATLAASNGSSGTIYYQGTSSGGTSTAIPSASQTVSGSGTYYFRAQSSAGCWGAEGSAIVAINSLPSAVTASGAGTFCNAATISATNGGSGTIYFQGTTSGGTSTATPATSQIVTASGTYYFRAQSSAGCWGGEGSVTVTINPLPAAITGSAIVCAGSTITLASTSTGGTWTSGNNTVASIGSGSGVVSGLVQGVAPITYTLPTGCTATAAVSVQTTPGAITGSSSVCAGSTISLSNTASGGVWTSSNTSIATVGAATGVVTGVSNGSAVITYATACGSAVTKSITVGSSPVTGTLAVCSGSTTTLSNATPGGVWTSASTAIATVGSATGIVSGVASGTATISYSGGGCSSTAVVTVNVAPSFISGTTSACAGLTSTLSCSTLYGSWSSSNTAVATVGSSTGIVNGISAGTAVITYSTGCGAPATRTFTVNALPAAIGGASSICVGSTTTLTDATASGSWTSGSTSIATIGAASGSLSGVAAGTAVITYTLSTGCKQTTSISVNPLPAAIAGTMAFCKGDNSSLTNTTSAGTWTSGNSAIASIGSSNGMLLGVAAGNTTITYSLPTGCKSVAPITVNPLPAAITGSTSVCAGSTTVLASSGTGAWSSSNALAAAVGSSSGIVTGLVANTVSITYTLPTGCSTGTLITVNAAPTSVSGSSVVCVGASTSLTEGGSGTWSTSNALVATVGSVSGLVSGIASGTVDITYSFSNGCFTTKSITVNPLPNAGSISGSATFCEGTSTAFSNAVSGGVWSSSDVSNASVDASGLVTGESGGTAVISYTVSNSCGTADAIFNVTVNPIPVVDTIVAPASLCAGSTVALSNSVAGGVWASSSATIASIGSTSGILSGLATGSTLVTYTVTNACGSDFDTTTIAVLPLPAAISGILTVCVGNTVTLASSGSGIWSSSNASVATVGSASGVVYGVSAGSVIITFTASSGCFATASVTVNSLPVITAGSNVAVCNGSAAGLSASGGISYSWAPAAGLTSATGASVTATPSVTTIYTATGINANGCSSVGLVTVTVNALPVVSAGANIAVCRGNSASLTATGGLAYTWSPVAGLSATTGASVVASPTVTTVYTVVGTSSFGCTNYATVTVSINGLPAITSVGNNGPLCSGANLNLTSVVSGGGGVYNYSWSGPASFTSTAQNPVISAVTTAGAGTYFVAVTDGNGCVSSASGSTTVAVIASPAITSVSNSGAICAGSNLSLNAAASGGTGSLSFSWSGPNSFTAAVASPAISGAATTATGTYSVTITDANGCVATGSNVTIATVNPMPSAGVISGPAAVCIGSTATLSNSVSGGVWSCSSALATIGSTTGVVTGVAMNGLTISYSVTNSYSCTAVATKSFTVLPVTGNIYTFAGTGTNAYAGDGGTANLASVQGPRAITTDNSGNVYFCDVTSNVVRKVSANGVITTVAGNGTNGTAGDGGPATAAQLSMAGGGGIAVDNAGNLYISNTFAHTIRKVSASTGIITRIAGTGTAGYTTDGIAATAARINAPMGLTLDSTGNIYFADQSNHRVRRIDAGTGIITTIAGNGSSAFSGDGGPATAARLSYPKDVTLDNMGNMYIADATNNVIRKYVFATGIITTIAGNNTAGSGGDGGPAVSAQFNCPARATFDGGNYIYVADQNNNKIRQIDVTSGIITTVVANGGTGFSGDGGAAVASHIWVPCGIATDRNGYLYIADANNRRIRVASSVGSIRIKTTGSTTITSGSSVTFIANSAVSNSYTTYQWQQNGINVGTGGATFTTSSISNGDVFRCILTVTPECGTAFSDTSNSITIAVAGARQSNTTTGVEGEPYGASLKVFPNPVHDQINIEASEIQNGALHVSVFDQTGRVVFAKEIQVTDSRLQESIDMQSMPVGMYIISLTDQSGKNMVVRFVKN